MLSYKLSTKGIFPNPMCPGSSGVEQRIENPRVGGSNPPPGTTFPHKNQLVIDDLFKFL